MDILEMLKTAGVEFAEGKEAEFDKMFRKEYKHIKEVEKKINNYEEDLEETKNLLKEATDEINKFKDMDVEGIKKAAEDWKIKAEEAEKQAKKRVAELEFDSVLKEKLSEHKFSSEYARKGIIDDIRAKQLPLENGNIIGLDDVIKTIKESQPTAFVIENQTPPPMYAGTGKEAIRNISKKDFQEMGYLERFKLKNEQPELYKNLKE